MAFKKGDKKGILTGGWFGNSLAFLRDYFSDGWFEYYRNISATPDPLDLTLSVLSADVDAEIDEILIHVDATELNIFVADYEQVKTSMFSDFNVCTYGMGDGTNMPNDWITKCDDSDSYDSERTLMDNLITEAYMMHGVCMDFYVTSYNTSYDNIWGEDLNRFFERVFDVMVYYNLPREEKLWSKFGIEGVDEFSMYISKLHFRDASTVGMDQVAGNRGQGTYGVYIPKIGDIIRSKYNNYIYEVVEVKEEVGMYLLSKQHIWELIVKPFKDQGMSLSATTSAGMAEISAYTDTISDIFDTTNVVNTEKEEIIYSPPVNEKDNGDFLGGW